MVVEGGQRWGGSVVVVVVKGWWGEMKGRGLGACWRGGG